MEWERKFDDHILERGYDYYRNKRVNILSVKDEMITATVEGMDTYDVEITLSKGLIIDMECSCPYAESGSYCKHMAAVLYTDDNDHSREDGEESIVDFVTRVDATLLRQFLISALEEDDRLFVRFKSYMNPKLSNKDMDEYKRQVDLTILNHQDRHGFISYYDASDF